MNSRWINAGMKKVHAFVVPKKARSSPRGYWNPQRRCRAIKFILSFPKLNYSLMTGQPLAACEYKTGKTLGQGSYATVKEAVKISTGEKFAVKMISKKLMKGKEHMILNEIEILKKISKGHPNVLTLHDYFETPNNLYLVMDLCTGGELFDRICQVGQFYEKDAAKIVFTTLGAVSYLHKLNVVHRDLKPENLLFKTADPDSELLIADYGLSKLVGVGNVDGFLKTTCGTPGLHCTPDV